MLNRLLSLIKCSKIDLGKSKVTSGNAYRVTLVHGGERCSFVFNDNFKNESDKKDFLYCLFLDAQCYDNARDVWDFAREYFGGYDDMKSARKAYDACRKQYARLHRLFNKAEIELLSTIE